LHSSTSVRIISRTVLPIRKRTRQKCKQIFLLDVPNLCQIYPPPDWGAAYDLPIVELWVIKNNMFCRPSSVGRWLVRPPLCRTSRRFNDSSSCPSVRRGRTLEKWPRPWTRARAKNGTRRRPVAVVVFGFDLDRIVSIVSDRRWWQYL